MRLNSMCIRCLVDKQEAGIAKFKDEEKNTAYMKEIAKIIGADSVGYLDLKHAGMLTGGNGCGFCTACFDGDYPTAVPEETCKNRFERPISENPKYQK